MASFGRPAGAAAAGLAAAALLAASGCGGAPTTSGAAAQRQYAANAASLIGELHDDLTVSEAEGGSLASARRALLNDSELLATLVAYTDFGACRKMVRNVGAAVGTLLRVERTLGSACGPLERGSRLFTDAATRHDPRTLVAAARTVLQASPILYQAEAELETATRR